MTRACAVGTNNFEKESGTPFFKLSAITVDWNSICLILRIATPNLSDLLVNSSTPTKLHFDAVIFTHRWNFRCYFDVINQW